MGHKQFNTTQKYYNRPDAEKLVAAVDNAQQKSEAKKKNQQLA